MKQIYSFAILFCTVIFANKANAQNISQNFNSQAEVNTLISQCWNFSGAMFSSTTPIEGTGSLVNSTGGAFSFNTPFITTGTSVTISFSYNIISATGGSKIFIESVNGATVTEIDRINSLPTGVNTYSATNTLPAGSSQIRIRTTGTVNLIFDQLVINAPYTYVGGCDPSAIILPVKLNSFAGNLNNGKVNLNWSVSANETGEYFEVEKSNNGSKFEKGATVIVTEKAGTENYSISFNADAGNTHYFRLKVFNKDGSVHYSKVLSFTSLVNNSAKLKVLQNPVVNGLSFNYQTEGSGTYQVNLYAASGLKISTTQTRLQKGSNLVSLDVTNNLPKGIYLLEVSNGSEKTTTTIVK